METRLHRTRPTALAILLISSNRESRTLEALRVTATGTILGLSLRERSPASALVSALVMARWIDEFAAAILAARIGQGRVKPIFDANSNASVVRWLGRGDDRPHRRRTTPMQRPERARPPS